MAEVLLSEQAREWLADQQPDVTEQVKDKLRRAGENPDHYLRPLTGEPEYKLRIGDYRALIDWRKTDDELWVLELGHRDGFYN
jgi:mRNA interferase RelE/StbE